MPPWIHNTFGLPFTDPGQIGEQGGVLKRALRDGDQLPAEETLLHGL